jgi:hypothetical protein
VDEARATDALRVSSLVRFVVLVAVVVGVGASACKSDRPDACSVDTDCPQGSFCREGLCAAVSRDGGTTDSAIATCGTADNPCPDNDSGTGSSGGPTCKDVYMICSGDFECCPALACKSGACR